MQNDLETIRDWLAEHPGASGAMISKGTGIGSHLLYPCLAELEQSRAVSSEWESPEPRADGRPRRRLYWIAAIRAIDLTKPVEG